MNCPPHEWTEPTETAPGRCKKCGWAPTHQAHMDEQAPKQTCRASLGPLASSGVPKSLRFTEEDFDCVVNLLAPRMTFLSEKDRETINMHTTTYLCTVFNALLAERLEEYLKNGKGEYSSMSEGKRLVAMLRSALEKKVSELKALKEMIEKAPEVFASIEGNNDPKKGPIHGELTGIWRTSFYDNANAIYRARLVCISRITEKEEKCRKKQTKPK